MLKFNYRGRTVAYMPLAGATLPQVRTARALAADMAGTDTLHINIVRVA